MQKLTRRALIAGGLAAASGAGMAFALSPAAAPDGLLRLARAYPDALAGVEANALIWRDGTRMTYDPGVRHANHEKRLAEASLWDQMDQRYTPGPLAAPPAPDIEPGRLRHEPFFRKMYGADEAAVRAHLVEVPWCVGVAGEKVVVTRLNGVDKRVAAIIARLAALPPDFRRYLSPMAGGFLWRPIAGTARLSVHSFGIALDIATTEADYWRWNGTRDASGRLVYRNRIPPEIVGAFEAEGFIWGGQWYHYDTMHFEYRPELLAAA